MSDEQNLIKIFLRKTGLDQKSGQFWCGFSLPVALTIFFSWYFFIPLPMADYWDVLYDGFYLQEKTVGGYLHFFWEPFVDQKMVFSKLFITVLAGATRNSHYGLEIVFGLLGQLTVLLTVSYLIRSTLKLVHRQPRARVNLYIQMFRAGWRFTNSNRFSGYCVRFIRWGGFTSAERTFF